MDTYVERVAEQIVAKMKELGIEENVSLHITHNSLRDTAIIHFCNDKSTYYKFPNEKWEVCREREV